MYILRLYKNMKPPDSQLIEAYVLSWAKEKGVRIWYFKGGEDKSEGGGKNKYSGTKWLPCHAEKFFLDVKISYLW